MKVQINIKNAEKKICAIKAYRAITGASLKEAKNAVELEINKLFGANSLSFKPYTMIVKADGSKEDVQRSIDSVNSDKYMMIDGISCSIINEEDLRKLDFSASVNGKFAELSFKGPNITASMFVPSEKMVEVIEWVTRNF